MEAKILYTLAADDGAPTNLPPGAGGTPPAPAPSGSKPVEGQPGGTTQPGGPPKQQQGPGFEQFLPIIVIFVVMWFVLSMPQRRERKRHAALMAGLKKGDRVVTTGGIVGTVTSLKDAEVVVKVDEANNTKMTFLRDSIRGVLDRSDDDKDGETK